MGCSGSVSVAVDEVVQQTWPKSSKTSHTGSADIGDVTKCVDQDRVFSQKLGHLLGQGSYGKVWAFHPDTGQKNSAIKILDLNPVTVVAQLSQPRELDHRIDPRRLARAQLEADLWLKMGKHHHVVELFVARQQASQYSFVMEQCGGGSLAKWKSSFTTLPESFVSTVCYEMLVGVEHVHACGVAHRDIKPGNFLFGGPEGQTVKLTDFGLSAPKPPAGLYLQGCCGSPPYMSPEMAGKEGHDCATDVWSLGAVFYMMLMGTYPYVPEGPRRYTSSSASFKEAIVEGGGRPPMYVRKGSGVDAVAVEQPSPMAVDFLQQLLVRDSAERMDATMALQLEFVAQGPGRLGSLQGVMV